MKQPKGTSICGHLCVAKAANLTLYRVMMVIGHSHSTSTKELMKFFDGYTKHREHVNGLSICIARPTDYVRKSGWHWVVSEGNNVWDPEYACWLNKDYWSQCSKQKITTWFQVGKKKQLSQLK